MTWKCSTCGFENDKIKTICDGGCGYIRFGKVILTSKVTRRCVELNIDTSFGKNLLAFAGEDARFASEPQFHVMKDTTVGKWFIVPDEAVKNPTFLNGFILSAKAALRSGLIISVGPER